MSDYIVFLILKEKAADLLETAVKEHCWYASSPQNQEFVDRYLSQNKNNGKLLSSFVLNDNLEKTFVDIFDEIMDHHNEYTDPPGIKVLDVVGIELNDNLLMLLKKFS